MKYSVLEKDIFDRLSLGNMKLLLVHLLLVYQYKFDFKLRNNEDYNS